MKIKAKVKKWGNSGGIPLPRKLIGRVVIVEIKYATGKDVVV